MTSSPRLRIAWFLAAVLSMAALACNAAGLSSGEGSQATVAAVYATITAQALTAGPDDTVGEGVTATAPPPDSGSVDASDFTSTPPAIRPGNGQPVQVPPCQGTITIDGLVGEAASVGRVSMVENTYGADEWSGTSDLSGEGVLCWTDDALYVGVEVTDDVHSQDQTGSDSWRGDEVEMVFDAQLQADYDVNVWNNDDTQLGLSPGSFAGLPPSVVEYRPDVRTVPESDIAAQAAGSGYGLEAVIPWSVLRVDAQAGAIFGFCLALSDNDQPGEASQDSMVSHCPDLFISNPTTWTTLELLAE